MHVPSQSSTYRTTCEQSRVNKAGRQNDKQLAKGHGRCRCQTRSCSASWSAKQLRQQQQQQVRRQRQSVGLLGASFCCNCRFSRFTHPFTVCACVCEIHFSMSVTKTDKCPHSASLSLSASPSACSHLSCPFIPFQPLSPFPVVEIFYVARLNSRTV